MGPSFAPTSGPERPMMRVILGFIFPFFHWPVPRHGGISGANDRIEERSRDILAIVLSVVIFGEEFAADFNANFVPLINYRYAFAVLLAKRVHGVQNRNGEQQASGYRKSGNTGTIDGGHRAMSILSGSCIGQWKRHCELGDRTDRAIRLNFTRGCFVWSETRQEYFAQEPESGNIVIWLAIPVE